MTETELAVLDVVADRQAATNASCPEADVVQRLQYVFAESAIVDAIDSLTASPARLETLPGNAGPEYRPTLEGWLASKHKFAVQGAIGAAMRVIWHLAEAEHRGDTYDWAQLAAEGRFDDRDYPLVRATLVSAGLCAVVATESVWKVGQKPQATFRLPLDHSEIARLKGVDEFVEYRRRNPILLAYLKTRWARELNPDRRFVLRATHEHFIREGDWPKSRDVEARLVAAGRGSLADVGRETSLFRSGNPLDERDQVKLTLAGLLHCTGSEEEQQLVVRLLSAAGKLARSRPSMRSVKLTELGEQVGIFKGDEGSLLTFVKLVEQEPDAYFSQGGPTVDDYAIALSPRLIRYAEATRLEDVLLETYRDEIRGAVSLLEGEQADAVPTAATTEFPRKLRIEVSVHRTHAIAAMSRFEELADHAGELVHVWNIEIVVGRTVILGMWGVDRELFTILEREGIQEPDITFGIVAALRRTVRHNLQSVSGQNAINVGQLNLFRPVSTLDPRVLIERDIERTLFDFAWMNLRGQLERIERSGGAIHELKLEPASLWTKNEPLLRKDRAYRYIREFYDTYAYLMRNRSFMPDQAGDVAALIDRLQTLGLEALNELWEVTEPTTDDFWKLLLRQAPSQPEGGAFVWSARISDLELFASIDGLRMTAAEIFELLTGRAVPQDFPWTPKVAGDIVKFEPRGIIGTSVRPHVGVVVIEGLEIQSLRNIPTSKMTFVYPGSTERRPQCLTLLGENGSGKTTILQALALSMLDGETASSVLSRFAVEAPLIRAAYEHGRVSATFGGKRREVEVRKRESIEYAAAQPHEAPIDVPIYAYGAHRSIGAKSSDLTLGPAEAVATLFDPRAALISGEVWLLQAQNAALRTGGLDELFYEGVRQLLKRLLPGVDSVEVNQGVIVNGPEMGTAPLAGLSGGYLTMTSWIIDLLARAAAVARREGQAVEADFATRMRGVLMIDEIDLHLHPRWQSRVIRDIREAFPRMTLVVTTHSPMVVLDSVPGDVFVIDRKGGGLELVPMNVPPGADADRILTDWFGLASVTDQETTGLLSEYNALLVRGTPHDGPRLKELERILRNRFGTFAVTPIERAALEVAARIMAEEVERFEQLSVTERRQLGQRIAAAVEERAKKDRQQ